jgi:hypothetical protein
MKWYEEITKELLADFKNFSLTMVFRYCGANKVKMNKDKMNKLIMSSQCRGGVSALDELFEKIEKEEKVDKDFVLGYIHLMRMNIWNEAVDHSDGMLKKISLETAMQLDPKMQDLVSPERIRGVQNVRL